MSDIVGIRLCPACKGAYTNAPMCPQCTSQIDRQLRDIARNEHLLDRESPEQFVDRGRGWTEDHRDPEGEFDEKVYGEE